MNEQTPKEIIISNKSIDMTLHEPVYEAKTLKERIKKFIKTTAPIVTPILSFLVSCVSVVISINSCNISNSSVDVSKNSLKISQYSFKLNKKNQPLIIKEKLHPDNNEESDTNDKVKYLIFTTIQGQVSKAYLSIKEDADFYIKKITFETEESETETGETTIKIPYRTSIKDNGDSTEEDDSDTLILTKDKAYPLELLLYDTTGNCECYYIVVPPEDDKEKDISAGFKITKTDDKGNSYDTSTVRIYGYWVVEPCIFNCNIVNKSTIRRNISDYNNNDLIKEYSATVDADEIYKHINDTRDLIEK